MSDHPFIGKVGEFTDGMGRVIQCRVTGAMIGMILVVTYRNPDTKRVVKGAYIAEWQFRPDKEPSK